MIKILKEIKPFISLVLIIIVLLFFQAATELALPSYMSNIVNTGIQQYGIENHLPELIRVEAMENIKLISDEKENEILENSYKLLDIDRLTGEEYNDLLNKYPSIERQSLYKLYGLKKEETKKLQSLMKQVIPSLALLEGEVNLDAIPIDGQANLSEYLYLDIKDLDKDELREIRLNISRQLEFMPEGLLSQTIANYIKREYRHIGIDVGKIQSDYILRVGGMMLLISLMGMIAAIMVRFLSAKVSSGIGSNLRDKVFQKVTAFSSEEFQRFSTASLITRNTNDIQRVQMFTIMMLRMIFYAPILGIGGVIKALRTNVSMAWIILVGILAILTLIIFLFSVTMPKFKKVQQLVDRVNMVMRESLTGMLVIRAFNTEKYEEKKFDDANTDLTKTNLFVSKIMTIMNPTMMLIMNGITLLVVWVGALEIDKGVIQVGDMMAFMQYTMQIIMSFLMVSIISIMLPRASVSAQRITEVLDTKISITNPSRPVKLKVNRPTELEFRNVSFRYPGAEEYVLENISFIAQPGETTAFIGSTGSGKSTLINLIPRFYDVTEGEILFKGVDIRDIKLHDLRERIGYVPQEAILFSGTIESNIRYGKNANVGDEAIAKAVEIAQATNFIEERENKLLSGISQGGSNVSGGQRQRLSIARALVKKPDLFIFDDSFSALDFKTDAALRMAIQDEIHNSTILIVAQRISTIMKAEKIIVLDEGKIVGEGTHRQLINNCQVYRQIALSQLSKEELAI